MKLLSQIHARFGDFWWYTGLQFAASRCGDLINAFIGLWLVPKYVGMEELGAVLPLANFAMAIALPLSVFSTAFFKQVNVLSVRGEKGKLKTLLRGVFLATAIFVVGAIVAVRVAMPWVLERVRVEKGTLGIAVVGAALLITTAPIYINALQSMKWFATVSVINLCCAPIRLIVMLLTMPFRALTGYFVGQSAGPAFQILASAFALRRELGPAVRAEPYWTKPVVADLFKYMGLVSVGLAVASLVGFVEPLVIRQRLPDVDSAAYYMISRFAEIGSYMGMTLTLVVFPYVSEAVEHGVTGDRLIARSMLGAMGFGLLCAVGFSFVGGRLLALFPDGSKYTSYVPELVGLTMILASGIAVSCFTTGETAANRFCWLWWFVPLHLTYLAVVFVLTGHGYLRGWLPDSAVDAIAELNACRLDFLLGLMGSFAVLKLMFVGIQLIGRRGKK